jgi:hypothetical protein
VDSNILIDLPNVYPPEIFCTLWANIEGLVQSGRFLVPELVAEEYHRGTGGPWLQERPQIIRPVDESCVRCLKVITTELTDFIDHSKTTTDADQFLVALAMSENQRLHAGSPTGSVAVLTGENPKKQHQVRLRIPDACQHFGIECYKLLEFIKLEGWTF